MKRRGKEQFINDILDAVTSCKYDASGGDFQLAQVAVKAQTSVRTINRYFPDKNHMLYLAAVRFLGQQHVKLVQQYTAMDMSGKTGLERLMSFLKSQKEYCAKYPVDAVMMVAATASVCRVNANIDTEKREISIDHELHDIVVSCVEEGIKDGSIRGDVEASPVCQLISSTFDGLQQHLTLLYSKGSETIRKNDLLRIFDWYVEMLQGFLQS